MPTPDAFGLAHLWEQSDLIIRLVAFTLAVMSVASWYLIVVRSVRQLRARRHDEAVEAFWGAASLDRGLEHLSKLAPDSPFEALAPQGCAATGRAGSVASSTSAARAAVQPGAA